MMPSREARAAAFVAAATLVAVAAPIVLNAALCPPGRFFFGVTRNLADQCAYLAWMRQAAEGRRFWENLFTPEKGLYAPPIPTWLVLGRLAALTGLSMPTAYHIGRIAAAATFLAAAWLLVGAVIREPPSAAVRPVAYLTIVAGAGLGAFASAAGHADQSADILMPELWGFVTILSFPHSAWALVFLTLAAAAGAQHWRRRGVSILWLCVGTGAAALTVFTQPYGLPALIAALSATAVFGARRRLAAVAVSHGLIAGVGAVFLALVWYHSRTTSVLHLWASRDIRPAPPPHKYLLGYGFLMVGLAVAAARLLRRAASRHPRPVFVWSWIIVGWILVYAFPLVPFARRCVHGLFIPMSLAAAPQIAGFATRLLRARKNAVAGPLLVAAALLCPTSFWYARYDALERQARLPADVKRMWSWLEHNTPPDAVLLAGKRDAVFLPPTTLRHVFAGHQFYTLDYRRRMSLANTAVAAGVPAVKRLAAVKASHADYLVVTRSYLANVSDWPALQAAVVFRSPNCLVASIPRLLAAARQRRKP